MRSRKRWGPEAFDPNVEPSFGFAEDRCRVRAGARPPRIAAQPRHHPHPPAGLSIYEARENFREDHANAITLVTGRAQRAAGCPRIVPAFDAYHEVKRVCPPGRLERWAGDPRCEVEIWGSAGHDHLG